MARKNSNARKRTTQLQSSDMKLQDIQTLAAAGVGTGEVLSRYKINSKTLHQFLAKNFGSDEQGKKQLIDRLDENDKKRFEVEKVEEELAAETEEKPEPPKKKPRTMNELRLEAEFLNQAKAKLEDKISQAENGNQVLDDLLKGYKKQLDETEKKNQKGLDDGRAFLEKAEGVLKKNQELIITIREEQAKLNDQIQQLCEETASAIQESNTIKLVVDTEAQTITASNQMELDDEGWQKIMTTLLDQNRDLVGWQYSLAARLKAILQNHQDARFEIECDDEAINALVA
jgi:chromosome segregation ATPase